MKTASIKELMLGNNNLPKSDEALNNTSDDEDAGVDPQWNTPVSEESLKSAWLGYAARIETSNSRLFSILNNHIPSLQKGNVVYLELINTMQETEMMREKTALFKYLKTTLKNARLSLEIAFKKEENIQVKAFTASDKFKVMMDKNPALADLSRLFDLDLE